jgi:hypothetical protein
MSKQILVLPNYRVELKLAPTAGEYTPANIETINSTLKVLVAMGVPVAEDSLEFDRSFPHIAWRGDESDVAERHISLTKAVFSTPEYIATTFPAFISHFIKSEPEPVKLRLTDDYEAVATAESVQVGCQTIPFDKVKELYNTMIKLQK